MLSTFEKLNLKDHRQIVVLNAPESFEPELSALHGVTVLRSLDGIKEIGFSLAFVTKQKEVDALAKSIAAKAKGDAVVWFAYPKGTSKRYQCEFNRDIGWKVPGKLGFEPVRSVAIDEDWTGVRFRRVEFVKTMTRAKEWALTAEGKARAARR
ncbi:MAG: hypothetical protein ACLQU1_32945 [Bryobacteraceae bacterium]